MKGHERPLTFLKYNREGDLLFSCAKDNTPTVWFADNGERLGTYKGHNGAVWCCDVSRELPRPLLADTLFFFRVGEYFNLGFYTRFHDFTSFVYRKKQILYSPYYLFQLEMLMFHAVKRMILVISNLRVLLVLFLIQIL